MDVTEKGRKLTNRYNSIPSHKKSENKMNLDKRQVQKDVQTVKQTCRWGKRNKDNIQR